MPVDKYICHSCIGDEYIKKNIIKSGSTDERCSYCASRKKTLPLDEVAEKMHDVFSRFYQCKNDADLYRGYSFGDSAETIIIECLEVDDTVANDIHEVLKDEYNDYYNGDCYDDGFEYKKELPSSETFDYKWREIKKSLQGEARFFNQKVKEFFDEIFYQIDSLHTTDNQQAVSIISPEQGIFRARVFEDYSKVEKALEQPEKNFGPPPQPLATSGRMNAQGIPVFYGAFSPEIAIAEVRPAVGSHVVVAEFYPLKPLRLLNISSLDRLRPGKGSYFDPKYGDQLAKTSFLRTLSRKLTLPVSGKNTESEYLITQAVAEYLSVLDNPIIDGIIFKSTQVALEDKSDINTTLSQHNIVLFSKSSKVVDADVASTKYSVNLFEEDYEDDRVYSWLEPKIQFIYPNNQEMYRLLHRSSSNDYSIKLDTKKMVLHEIEGIAFTKKTHAITELKSLYSEPDD